MKTILTSKAVLVLCFVAAILLGCGSSDDPSPASCNNDIDTFEAALNAYIADPVKSKCEALKSAAANLLDCPGLTAAQRKEYEDSVDGMVCD